MIFNRKLVPLEDYEPYQIVEAVWLGNDNKSNTILLLVQEKRQIFLVMSLIGSCIKMISIRKYNHV